MREREGGQTDRQRQKDKNGEEESKTDRQRDGDTVGKQTLK